MNKTSLLAWIDIENTDALNEMQKKIYTYIKEHQNLTHNELSYNMAKDGIILLNHKENVRKRCYDLRKMHLVRESGIRNCMITGRQATTWYAW